MLTLTLPALGAAQGTVRGTVIGLETGEPLAFTIVRLIPGSGQRFTDAGGRFAFSPVSPGLHLLSVRQIGYTPLDTQLVVSAATEPAPDLQITLRRLAVELPPITVFDRSRCTHPGPPDRTVTPELAAVFDQLLENARRLELLADSYPFRFLLERTFRTVDRSGDSLAPETDTLDLASSETRRPYRPGRVVEPGPAVATRLVSLPSLRELGDSVFLHHHCFRLAGRDTIAGETLVRIDFEPAEALRWSDVAGAAYLDSITFQLRYTTTTLTRPERAQIRGIRGLAARVRFRDIVGGIVLHDSVHAVTTFRSGRMRGRIETQRLLDVRFERPVNP